MCCCPARCAKYSTEPRRSRTCVSSSSTAFVAPCRSQHQHQHSAAVSDGACRRLVWTDGGFWSSSRQQGSPPPPPGVMGSSHNRPPGPRSPRHPAAPPRPAPPPRPPPLSRRRPCGVALPNPARRPSPSPGTPPRPRPTPLRSQCNFEQTNGSPTNRAAQKEREQNIPGRESRWHPTGVVQQPADPAGIPARRRPVQLPHLERKATVGLPAHTFL